MGNGEASAGGLDEVPPELSAGEIKRPLLIFAARQTVPCVPSRAWKATEHPVFVNVVGEFKEVHVRD